MSEKPPIGLSPRERQIMDVVYRRGSATVQEVLEEMPDPPSYSAVRATMRVLEEKGRLRHKEEGRKYVYHPAVAPERARRNALQHIVKTFFGGSAEQAFLRGYMLIFIMLPLSQLGFALTIKTMTPEA